MVSLVPATASDIRDGTIETFSDIDRRGFRASVLVVVGGVLFGLAGLMALLALVRLVARFQKPSAATSRLVSDGAILRAVGRELRTVQRAREDGGWTPGLAGRALGALRIAAAYALGRHVARTLIQEPVDTHQGVVVGHLPRPTRQIGLVVGVFRWVRVQRVPPVALQVAPLRRVEDEAVEPVVADHRRDRVYPRAPVRAHRRQVAETGTVLVDQVADGGRQPGLGSGELGP